MLYFKDKTVSQKFPEKMIYIAPTKFGVDKRYCKRACFSYSRRVPDKMDLNINYATSGGTYVNG